MVFFKQKCKQVSFSSGFKITTVRIEQKNHENKLLTSKKKLLLARAFYSLFLFPLRVYQTTPASNSLISREDKGDREGIHHTHPIP